MHWAGVAMTSQGRGARARGRQLPGVTVVQGLQTQSQLEKLSCPSAVQLGILQSSSNIPDRHLFQREIR